MAKMQTRIKLSWVIALGGVLLGIAATPACSQTGPFQPVATGAKPWTPPPGWDPEPACGVGYYIAITTCQGCTGISYALCDGIAFTQCVCGGAPWPGATCPQTFACSLHDFPPENWMEFTDYASTGWAGLELHGDAGISAPTPAPSSTTDGG